ncbi:Autotransporter beta-domain protein [compost metagenome]
MHFIKSALFSTSLCSLCFAAAASDVITPGLVGRAYAINADGNVVVGDNGVHTFRWVQGVGANGGDTMTDLGTLPGGDISVAKGVNAVGNVVVGYDRITNIYRAFRWVEGAGANGGGTMTDLGTLAGGNGSIAYGVNAAGNIVVGYSNSTNGIRAFRWVEGAGANGGGTMTDLGTLAGGNSSSAYGVNAAGNVVVGQSSSMNGLHAFRWVEGAGSNGGGTMSDLGTLVGGNNSYATGVNAAGNVVVGQSGSANGTVAFRWTEATGMQSVEDWLAANGVAVVGITTYVAQGVSADGNIVVGALSNNVIFIARVTPGGSGMIDTKAFTQGLYRVANSGLLASNDAELSMNGLHSNPMRGLLSNGQSTMWVGGDVGRQQHGSYDSDLGIAEVGYAHRFNDALQFNVSVGRTYSKANTGLGGATKTQSNFVLPELVVSLPSSVYATISAYYGKGRSDIDRVYLNAGTAERSFADPSLTSIGARLRFDWLNAASLGKTMLTPYASLTYLETRMDGYAEQRVAFPVVWDARTERATTARIGLDAVRPVSERLTLLGRLEAAHRFESTGSATTGQLVGLSSFRFAGQDIHQNWLRVGAGLEAKVGEGIAGMMLNVTTQGEAPSYWLSANYRWVF